MSFFNLTQVGVQDPIKTATRGATNEASSCSNGIADPSNAGRSHSGPSSSYDEYTRMLTKHQRNGKGPNELYNTPITTSMNYGRWTSDASLKDQSWTYVPRRANVNSEMTRFVDEMALTNRDFSLF